MNENPVFQSIRNHQEPAPEGIMNKAILASKRKRFFAFQWHSLNVWYVGMIIAGFSVLFFNHHKEVSNVNGVAGVTSLSSGSAVIAVPAAMDVKPVNTPEQVKPARHHDALTKPLSEIVSTEKSDSSLPDSRCSTENVDDKQVAQQAELTVVEETQELKTDEVKQPETIVEEKSTEKSNSAKAGKKKRLRVKVVQP